ncbi:hypothetical protein MY4824_001129 [Beauveria thailandica]
MPLSQDFAEKLHQNLTDGLLLDLQLLCNGEAIGVHKIVLCSHSPVFLKALSGPYQEQDEGAYEIKDSSYPIVLGMIEFMYTGSYEAPDEELTVLREGNPKVLFHAGMVALADKYLISSLRELALKKYKDCVESETDFRSLLESVSRVYAIQGDWSADLGRILVDRLDSRLVYHIDEDGMEDLLREMSETSPQFGIDLAISLLLKAPTAQCSMCKETCHMEHARLCADSRICDYCGEDTNFERIWYF